MSQRKNAVVLTSTAIARLQRLVDAGEYCTLDDAASHIITSVLGSTCQYSPVLLKSEPVFTQVDLVPTSTPTIQPLALAPVDQAPEPSALDRLAAMNFDS